MTEDLSNVLGGILKDFRARMHSELEETIAKAVAEIEPPAGERGEPGTPGEKGEQGEAGADGKDGKDGQDRPITEPVLLTPGKAYPKHTAGRHRGGLWIATRDASDDPENDPSGWTCILEGWEEAKCDFLGDREFEFTLRGSNGSELGAKFQIPYPQHKGIYEPEQTYSTGEIVTKGAAMFMATEPTEEAPPGGVWTQILVAPRGKMGPQGRAGKDGVDGKDGRDGIDGKDGARGKPGRNGRDASLDPEFIAELKKLASETKAFEDGRDDSYAITSFRGYFSPSETYRAGDVVVYYEALYICAEGGRYKTIGQNPNAFQVMFQSQAGGSATAALGLLSGTATAGTVAPGGVTITGYQNDAATTDAFQVDPVAGTITVVNEGVYRVSAWLLGQQGSATQNQTMFLDLSIDSVPDRVWAFDVASPQTSDRSFQFSVIRLVPAGTVLALELSATADMGTFTIENSSFELERLRL